MLFWQNPIVQEIARQVLIALCLAILSVLGYDRAVAQPRLKRLQREAELSRRTTV